LLLITQYILRFKPLLNKTSHQANVCNSSGYFAAILCLKNRVLMAVVASSGSRRKFNLLILGDGAAWVGKFFTL
jgi:hypothetical protein